MNGLLLSAIVFVVLAGGLLQMHFGLRRMRQLRDLPDSGPEPLPTLSVVVSALNEAHTIEPALRSLLAVDYPGLQVIAINDRSTDQTGEILERMKQSEPRLKVLHVLDLPPGWLGKNHALQRGSEMAGGDWLLFTDADVHFEPQALGRAVRHAVRERLDHLVVLAEFHVREHLLAALLLNFMTFMFLAHAPWRVGSSRTTYIGMGAFNLVRSTAYHSSGAHQALRMEVVDDLMLGRQLKLKGFRQGALLGMGAVTMEWYRNAAELMRGLEKNSLAAAGYSVTRLAAGSVAVLLARVWPFVGLFVTGGWTWWLNLGSVLAILSMYFVLVRLSRWSRHSFWWWPVAPVLMLAILWRAVLLTLRRGGIVWRGTRYPLEELRKAHLS